MCLSWHRWRCSRRRRSPSCAAYRNGELAARARHAATRSQRGRHVTCAAHSPRFSQDWLRGSGPQRLPFAAVGRRQNLCCPALQAISIVRGLAQVPARCRSIFATSQRRVCADRFKQGSRCALPAGARPSSKPTVCRRVVSTPRRSVSIEVQDRVVRYAIARAADWPGKSHRDGSVLVMGIGECLISVERSDGILMGRHGDRLRPPSS
jgi:hypothetical protein